MSELKVVVRGNIHENVWEAWVEKKTRFFGWKRVNRRVHADEARDRCAKRAQLEMGQITRMMLYDS